jgi:hypothetical protein
VVVFMVVMSVPALAGCSTSRSSTQPQSQSAETTVSPQAAPGQRAPSASRPASPTATSGDAPVTGSKQESSPSVDNSGATCEEIFQLDQVNQILGEDYTSEYEYPVKPTQICYPKRGPTTVGMIRVMHDGANRYQKESSREFSRPGSHVERIDLGDEAIYVKRGGAQYVAALFGDNYVVVELVEQQVAPEALEQLAEYADARDP